MPLKRTVTWSIVVGLVALTALGYGALYAPTTVAGPEPSIAQMQIAGAIGQMATQLHAVQAEIQQQRADAETQSVALSEDLHALAGTVERLAKAIESDREDRAKRWPR